MGKVRYGQSGYDGSSRSLGARQAEHEGLLPLTRAAKATGVSARRIGYFIAPREWHHVSKFAHAVDYYDTEEIRRRFGPGGDLEHAKVEREPKFEGRTGVADFTWTQWVQSGRHRQKPRLIELEGARFRETPSFYVITAADGQEWRKKKGTVEITNLRED